jgi:hypothetical protein
MQNYRAITVLLGALVAIASGCRERVEPQFVSNATGVVKVAGAPAASVYVYLQPVENPQAAVLGAKTDASGQFSVPVPAPGEYALTATWPTVTLDHGEEIEGDDRFRGKHAKPESPIRKVTIQAGENTLPPIELKR